jgi:hypothetical protein
LLAYHWLKAGAWEKALSYTLQAAEQAGKLYARPEVIYHYWHALDLLDRLPDNAEQNRVRADVILALIWLPGSMRDEEAKARMLRHLDQALADAETAGRAAIVAKLQAAKGDLLLDKALLVDSLERAEVSGDALTQAFVARRYGNYLAVHDRFETALGHITRAIDILGAQGEWLQQALVMAGPGRCFYARAGKIEESLGYAARLRQLGDSLTDASLRAWRAAEAEPYLYKGLWDEVIRVAEESQPIA